MKNPVINMCKKVEAMIILANTKTNEVINKPKTKSKGFVQRNISSEANPSTSKKMTPIEYVVDVVRTLREIDVKDKEDNKNG